MLDEVNRRAPDFAPGWVAAADARLQILSGISADWRHVEGEAAKRLFEEATEAVARARALAPDEPDTLRVQLQLEPVCPDWTKLETALLEARTQWPNHGPLLFLHGRLLLQVGRQSDAVPLLAEAYRLDPLHAAAGSSYASALRAVARTAEAVGLWSDLVHRFPSSPLPFFSLIFCLAGIGDWQAIERWLTPERLARYPGESERARNVMLAINSRREGSEPMRKRLVELAELAAASRRLPLSFAALLAQFCDLDWLYDILERTPFDDLRRPGGRLDAGDGTLELLFLPEFARLCAKLGFAEYWLAADRWPDFTREVEPLYDLKAECRRALAAPLPA
jgi:tetratricopeptide (TPR) repeat protein